MEDVSIVSLVGLFISFLSPSELYRFSNCLILFGIFATEDSYNITLWSKLMSPRSMNSLLSDSRDLSTHSSFPNVSTLSNGGRYHEITRYSTKTGSISQILRAFFSVPHSSEYETSDSDRKVVQNLYSQMPIHNVWLAQNT